MTNVSEHTTPVLEGEIVNPPPQHHASTRSTQPASRQAARSLRERVAISTAPPAHIRQPLTALSVLLTAASLLHALNVPWLYVFAVCLVGTLVAFFVTAVRSYKVGWNACLAGMIGVFCCGWLTWVTATTPWTLTALTTLLVGISVIGGAYGYTRWKIDHPDVEQATAAAVAAQKATRSRHEFVPVLEEARVKNVDVAWDDRNDDRWMLGLSLGEGAPTFKMLRMACEEIEKAVARQLDLPITLGSVQLTESESRRPDRAILVIPSANYMERKITLDLKEFSGPRSIHDPVIPGVTLLGEPMEQVLPGTHGLLSGMTNHGKSMFLDSHTKDTVRCTDNVTFLVSGEKGLRFTRPWLTPWLAGETHRPPVDWIAIDIDEALMMLSDLYRTVASRQKCPGAGHAGWVSTPEHPQITVFIDEGTDFLDHQKKIKTHTGQNMTFSELVLKIFRLGRSEGITLVLSSQRNTNSLLGDKAGDIKSQILYRSLFRTQSSAELSNMFTGSTVGINAGDLPPGCYFGQLSKGKTDPTLAKGWFLTEDEIGFFAIEGAHYAGVLDKYTINHMEYYAGRWSRIGQRDILTNMCNGSLPDHVATFIGEPLSDNSSSKISTDSLTSNSGYGLGGSAIERLRNISSGKSKLGDESTEKGIRNTSDWIPNDAELKAMLATPAIDDADRLRHTTKHEDYGAPSPDCVKLLHTLHQTRILDTDNHDVAPDMVPVTMLIKIAAEQLGWGTGAAGGQRIASALKTVNIERKRVTKEKITSYSRTTMLDAYHRMNS